MTRKAARKKRQLTARTCPSAAGRSQWMAIGTVVASTAITSLVPAPAAALEAGLPLQGPSVDQAAAAVYRLEIPAGPLFDVIAAFTQATGVQVTLALDSLGSIQSPGVSGTWSADQALRAIVANTGVRFHMRSATSAVIELSSLTEAVSVSGDTQRVASFFWIQSMVRHDAQRSLLFDLDSAIQGVARDLPDHPSPVLLTGVYHNLLREWAEV